MYIASNITLLDRAHESFTHVPLGKQVESVDFVALFLKKDWGAASIEGIRRLTKLLYLYPETTRIYTIGCEMTLPDADFNAYIHPQRDLAIADLCKLVLKSLRKNRLNRRISPSCEMIALCSG
jgi:hypothetical protein